MKQLPMALLSIAIIVMLAACGGAGSSGTRLSKNDNDIARESWANHVKQFRSSRSESLKASLASLPDEKGVAALKRKFNWHLDRADKVGMDKVKSELSKIESDRASMTRELENIEYAEPYQNLGDIRDIGKIPPGNSYKVIQVISTWSAIIASETGPQWFTMNTAGIIDGEFVPLKGIVISDGTQQYTTLIGSSKTIRAWRLVPDK